MSCVDLTSLESSAVQLKRGSGFTLVEVMVALTILSLVMLATVTALRTLANTQKSITRVIDRVDEVRSVSSFLRDTLEASVAGSSSGGLTLGGGGGDETFFQVGPEVVEWKSVVLFGESFGGSYLLRVAKEGDQLMLRWLEPANQGRALDWAAAPSRVLVNDLNNWISHTGENRQLHGSRNGTRRAYPLC